VSERKAILLILSEQDSFSIDFTKLMQELITRRALAFSADPDGPDGYIKDVIRGLEESGYATFEPKSQLVTLLPANIVRKFLESRV